MKSIIISPQAGFANRLRSMCSAKIVADICGRDLYHYWVEDEHKSGLEHVNQVKGIDPSFIFDLQIPKWEGDSPDICFTEWTFNEHWYSEQSTAIRKLKPKVIKKFTSIEEILNCEDEVILIETSHELRIPSIDWKFESMMSMIYQKTFLLNDRWASIYENIPFFDYGISIRRGDFLHFFPETNQPIDYIQSLIDSLKGSKYITSDDLSYKQELQSKCSIALDCIKMDSGIEQTILQFLVLSKSKNVLGTQKSSFPKQAALFRGSKYEEIV